jgi:hypothetical protein
MSVSVNEMSWQLRVQRLKEASAPLLAELHQAGVNVASVGSRLRSRREYAVAIPILMRQLSNDYPIEMLGAIARVLAVPEAMPYRDRLIEIFTQLPRVSSSYRYALAIAIAATTNTKNIRQTLALAEERSFGEDRMGLLIAIKKMRHLPEVMRFIAEFKDDHDLAKEIHSWSAVAGTP